MEHSAKFYRGAVAALNRAQRDFTVTVPELQAEYVALLAEAEAREASVAIPESLLDRLRRDLPAIRYHLGGVGPKINLALDDSSRQSNILVALHALDALIPLLSQLRDASVPTAAEVGLVETFGKLRELCRGVKAPPLEVDDPSAAEVIAAAEKALDTFARAYRISMEPFGLQIDQADGASHWMPRAWPTVGEFKNANDALAAIAKWKEAHNA